MQNRLFNLIGGMAALVATGLLNVLSASADVTLIDQNFDASFAPNQSFAYGYFGGDTTFSAYAVVADAGTAGTSALEMTNSASALGNGYAYAAVVYQETGITGNTNTSLAAYTLSFDARCSVASGNQLELRVIDANGGTVATAPTPPGYGNNISLNTTYTHYSLNLGDAGVFQGANGTGGFNPTTGQWQVLFQNDSGGGGNPAAWTMDIDNLKVTMIGNAPPPPPVTIYPPVKVPQGLNLYAGTTANGFFDRQEVASLQSSGLGWVGRATVANPVSYSFTVNSAPINSSLGSFQMYLVPNFPPTSANANAPDWFATAMVETFLVGNSTNAVFQFAYKVNEAAGNTMLLGHAPYTNAPGSWDGVTTPFYESGVLGAVTNDSGVLGTWTVWFTSDTNVTLITPNGTHTNLIIPAYNVSALAESSSFNIYLSMQAEDQGAMNQSFNYGNFAVTGVPNPFSDNFLADTTLNTSTWTNGLAISPANVFISNGHQQMLTWSKPASGFVLQGAGQLNGGWADLTEGPNPVLSGLFGQVVSANELPAGNNAFFRLTQPVPTQLQVLLPGEVNAPNTPTGKTGTPTAVAAFAPVTVTVNEVDANYHIASSTDAISLSSSDGSAILPTPPPALVLVNGTYTGTVYFQSTGPQTITASDTTTPSINSNTSSAVTVQ